MLHGITRLARAIVSEPWLMEERAFEQMLVVLQRRMSGELLSTQEITEAIGKPVTYVSGTTTTADGELLELTMETETANISAQMSAERQRVGVGVIPIHGIIAHRAAMVNNVSGPVGTSIEAIRRTFRSMMAAPEISAVVLELDTPGGSVSLVDEMAREIRETNGKPVVAAVNDLAASAGYYLASAADEISVTPSGQVGSIGVVATHQEVSGAAEREGIKTTLISAGKGKTDGNAFEPLSETARADMQRVVNVFYDRFVSAVIEGRNRSAELADGRTSRGRRRIDRVTVENEWQAKVFDADRAVEVGMVDRVETLEQTIHRVGTEASSQGERGQARLESDRQRLEDESRLRRGARLRHTV